MEKWAGKRDPRRNVRIGIEFAHISLDTGRIHLTVVNDVATAKIRVNLPSP